MKKSKIQNLMNEIEQSEPFEELKEKIDLCMKLNTELIEMNSTNYNAQ